MAADLKFEFSHLTKIVPDAFHGTDAANVPSIRKNGLRIGTGGTLYFGDGVYFYEGSKEHAIGYPKLKDKKKKVAVFRCEINLGNCIDLHNKQHKNALQGFAAKIRHMAFDSPAFRKKHNITALEQITEPFIINLAAIICGADTVRGTIGHDIPLYSGSRISADGRLVIAVRNLDKILVTSLEYEET